MAQRPPYPNRTSRPEAPSPHHGARDIISTIAAALLPAATAFAEVMDKEATVTEFWTSTAVLIFFGVFAWRWKYAVPVAALAALYGWLFYSGIFADLADPSVGLHIIAEAGTDYPTHARFATLMFVAANAIGLTWALRHYARTRGEWFRRGEELPRGFWDLPVAADPSASVRKAVIDEREDRA